MHVPPNALGGRTDVLLSYPVLLLPNKHPVLIELNGKTYLYLALLRHVLEETLVRL